MWVAGADGCPAGWLVVFRSINAQSPRAKIFEKIADVLAAPEQPKIIAVDIPIGLSKISQQGGRSAEIEARKVLHFRKSSIFPAPSRSALQAKSFDQAKDIERNNSAPPKMLTKQAFHLLEKIRQLDAIAAIYSRIFFECHPEVSFWMINQKREMSLPKRRASGVEERCKILARNKFTHSFLNTRIGSYKEHGRDDLIDACAAAWTAERILTKQAIRFPLMSEVDDTGLDMAIWA